MPYLPSADLSPPPIVQTVQTPDVSVQGLEHPSASEDTGISERSHQTPSPEIEAPLSTAEPLSAIDVDNVAPLATVETRAMSLQAPIQTEIVNSELGSVSKAIATEPPLSPTVPLDATASVAIPQAETAPQSDIVPFSEVVRVTAEPAFSTESLSAPWVDLPTTDSVPAAPETPIGQAETDTETDADTEAETDTETDAETDATPAAEPEQIFPRAATPEPFWANGAVLPSGILLPPSAPTNRPPAPLNVISDYQEFEPLTQIVTARGNVVLRLGSGVLSADRLWANLENRYVIVEGNVIFARGDQVVEADRGEYNLLQGQGSLFDARGTLFLPRTDTDFGDIVPNGVDPVIPGVIDVDPIANVRSTGSITFGTGFQASEENTNVSNPLAGGFVRRIRFEAEQLDFDAEGWYAQDIELTNDPFSPPELVIRGDTATLTRLTEFQDELFVENARLVFDQSFSVPLFRERVLLNRGEQDANPFFVTIGFDGRDRDGLFVERTFTVAESGPWELQVTPQFLVQRATGEGDSNGFIDNIGLEVDLTGALGPTTAADFNASFAGLDLDNLDGRLRANAQIRQELGEYQLTLEYIYRDRLFNGSLGFQDVQSSLGVVLQSPSYVLGSTGIVLNYQASAQYITAETDRIELLGPQPFEDDRASLGRFQGSLGLTKGFLLWQGETLPPTRDEGLRFTPVPRTPNLQLVLGTRGTYTYYTNSDTQESLSASAGILGELGNFSDDFFDSTVFNLVYTRSFIGDGTSPFFFDRNVDQNVLSGGILQQIYGPFRLGFQTSFNLDTGEVINTDYILEYSRRTYSFLIRINPTQSAGFVGFRLNEFGWSGRAARFGGADIRQVEGGVIRR